MIEAGESVIRDVVVAAPLDLHAVGLTSTQVL